MWRLRFVIIVFCMVLLTGCSGAGAARGPVSIDSYGQLQDASVNGPTYSVSQLQDFAGGSYGVCYGLESTVIGGLLCENNKLALASDKEFTGGLFKNGITPSNFVTNNPLGITGVSSYRITYNTPGAPFHYAGGATVPQIVSAAVLVPEINGQPIAESQIKGVVIWFHQTITSKGGVPSDFYGDITNIGGESSVLDSQTSALLDQTLGAAFASQGYIVLAPDYVGQGVNWQIQHPFVAFAQTNAQSGLNALKALRQSLANKNIALNNPTNLYITSFSEGGAYALWASRLAQSSYSDFLEKNGFILKHTFGVSGAYDVSNVTFNYFFANVNNSWDPSINTWNISPGLPESNPIFKELYPTARALSSINIANSKANLAGYLIATYAYYLSTPAAPSVLAPDYSPMKKCIPLNVYIMESNSEPSSLVANCPLPYEVNTLYNTRGLTQAQIGAQSIAAANGSSVFLNGGMSFNDLFVAAESGFSSNEASSFFSIGILTDPTLSPFNEQQDTYSFVTNSPLDLIYLDYDSTVTNLNSMEACGIKQGMAPGVKDLSASGLVNCINIHNGGGNAAELPLFTQSGSVPLFMDHGQSGLVLQLAVLNRLILTESASN